MKGFRFSSFLALGILTELPGIAAAQPVISGDYYEESLTGCCYLIFTGLPSKVLLTRVSCAVSAVPANITFVKMTVREPNGGPQRRAEYVPFGPPMIPTNGTNRNYTFASPLDFMIAPGKSPTISIFTDKPLGGTMECKISGRIQS